MEANTEAYPDVYIAGLEIEDTTGETTELNVNKRIPRYDDVCTSMNSLC